MKKNKIITIVTFISLQLTPLSFASDTPLAVHLYPQDQQVKVGDSVTWYLTAAGSEPLEYQWKKNGQNLTGQNSNTLKIAAAQHTDLGAYTCSVKNSLGSIETDFVQLSFETGSAFATSQKIDRNKSPKNAAAQNTVKPEK